MMANMMKFKGAHVCGVCSEGHATDQCPQIASNETYEEVNAVGYQGGQKYNPFSNTYNPGIRDHPNFRWANNDNVLRPQPNVTQAQPNAMQFPPRPVGQFTRPQAPFMPSVPMPMANAPNYDELLKSLAMGQTQLNTATHALLVGQQTNNKDITELKTHMRQVVDFMGQVVDFMGRFNEQGKLSGGVIPNPKKEQAQAITTRSGKVLEEQPRMLKKKKGAEPNNEDKHVAHDNEVVEAMEEDNLEKDPTTSKKESMLIHEAPKGINSNSNGLVTTNQSSCLPFPSRFAKSKKDKSDEELL